MTRAPRPRASTAIARLVAACRSDQTRVHAHVSDLRALITANAALEGALGRATADLALMEADRSAVARAFWATMDALNASDRVLKLEMDERHRFVPGMIVIAAMAFAAGALLK